jgi:hypothetical protein
LGADITNEITKFGATSVARGTLAAQLDHAKRKEKLAPDREHLNFGEDNNYDTDSTVTSVAKSL